jgi:hypothetical protein
MELSAMKIRSVSQRLVIQLVLSALMLLVISVFSAIAIRQAILDDKITMTRNITDAARSTAKNFYDRARNGDYDEKTAQDLATIFLSMMSMARIRSWVRRPSGRARIFLSPRMPEAFSWSGH